MAKTSGRPPRSKADVLAFRSNVAKHALALYRQEGFAAVSMRRLAKEVGCAPMTIYAHFDGKTDILKHLWADVLAEMADQVRESLESIAAPDARLQMAAQTFVAYWVDHPDHFRLVFMSNDVERADVSSFIKDHQALEHFQMFLDLVREVLPQDGDVKAKTDTLIAAMIGVALCNNTIRDYPWTTPSKMTEQLVTGIIS
ncbi:MAG: AcrR family transcriptional regulator [Paracoccaceae bacterium]|jgi:AcrR family transcriptional regulator